MGECLKGNSQERMSDGKTFRGQYLRGKHSRAFSEGKHSGGMSEGKHRGGDIRIPLRLYRSESKVFWHILSPENVPGCSDLDFSQAKMSI